MLIHSSKGEKHTAGSPAPAPMRTQSGTIRTRRTVCLEKVAGTPHGNRDDPAEIASDIPNRPHGRLVASSTGKSPTVVTLTC